MSQHRSIFEKVWDAHVVTTRGGYTLLYVDRSIVHDGSFHAFADLRRRGLATFRPAQLLGVPDHYVPTTAAGTTAEAERVLAVFAQNVSAAGIATFHAGDPRQGIAHVVGPEQGITLPGMLLVCGDSHTSTHGALGAYAFGIGQSEDAHVLATQTLWQRKPRTMRIRLLGSRGFGITAKDIVLRLIGEIGTAGAAGHVVEYAGPVIQAMSIEERLTVCNMSIEMGARAGIVAPDDTTWAYLEGRPFSPAGDDWEAAIRYWRTLPSDPEASFDVDISTDVSATAPMVTWGTKPDEVLPITGRVPDPATSSGPAERSRISLALAYMGLMPGLPLEGIPIDRVFIGSCTNSRIEDLRLAARVADGRKAAVPTIVVPGSAAVKAQAEAEGLDRVFVAAGFEWRNPGCSMCVAMNGDVVRPKERCVSTSNRNFPGRQGPGARTHLASPPMAAAAAVWGRLVDVRRLPGADACDR